MDIQSHQVTFDRAAHLRKTEVDPKEDQMNSPVLYGQPQSAFQLFCVKKMDALEAVLSRKCRWSGEKSKGSE